jgi:NADPH:quinone reductase-like Zn-dependent oxidoreductase
MKAAVILEHGGVEKVQVMDMPVAPPGEGEVAVDVRAASLNHLDLWVIKGGRGEMKFPHVIGSDAAGVVSAVGPKVQSPRVGAEVIVVPGLGCGVCEACRAGELSLCDNFGIIGLSRPGVFAERAVVPATNLLPKPAGMDFAEAGAIGVAYLTAWRMLMTRAKLRPGETALIHGIGGGVALAALQLAKLAGARVIVTSSSDDKLVRAEDLGADEIVNYRTEKDVAGAVKRLTGGRGVDVVIDTVGAPTLAIGMAAARKGGRIVNCGATGGADAQINMQDLYWR